MSKPGNDGGYVLPDIIDPPRKCIQFHIPDEPHHIAAFFGALLDLAMWFNWQRDDAHNGKRVADVWFQVFNEASENWLMGGSCCDDSKPLMIDELEYQMSVCEQLRYHDGKLQGLCCGVWEDIQGQPLGGNGQQPGGGTPQPPPGGCLTYHAILPANQQWNLPTVCSTGDTIKITNATGAAQDGNLAPWHCPNGQTFFAGDCVGFAGPQGGDPVAAANHMVPVIFISGTGYQIDIDTPFTVPMGISLQAVNFQVNDTPLDDNSGEYQFDVIVCNNQSAEWDLPQNLALVSGGWTTDIPGTSGTQSLWSPGNGWEEVDCNNLLGGSGRYNVVFIHWVFAAAIHIKHFDMTFNAVVGDLADSGHQLVNIKQGATDNSVISTVPVTGTGQFLFWDGDLSGVTEIIILIYGSDHNDTTCAPTGSALLKSVHMSGIGVGPS